MTMEEEDIKQILKDINSPPFLSGGGVGRQTNILIYLIREQLLMTVPGVPEKLLRELDYLQPPAFLERVLNNSNNNNNLSLAERESLLKAEKYRSKTFMINWPHGENTSFSGPKMAEAGFYCLNDRDAVSCSFCEKTIRGWSAIEGNPMMMHTMLNCDCRFVKGERCGNIEYSEFIAAQDSTLRHGDMKDNRWTVFDSELSKNPYKSTGYPTCGEWRDELGITTDFLPINPNYATVPSRLATFGGRWPRSAPSAQKTSDAGFYFTGFEDKVRCFFCGEGFSEWDTGADPWETHTRWSPDCVYLIQRRGQAYIDRVHREWKEEVAWMVEFCKTLGRSQKYLNQALEVRNGCYENPSELIEVADAIKNGEPVPDTDKNTLKPERKMTDKPRQSAERTGHCLTCRVETPANRIGLPCGHLIFCDACNKVQSENVRQNPDYKVICPICGLLLAASTKVFFG